MRWLSHFSLDKFSKAQNGNSCNKPYKSLNQAICKAFAFSKVPKVYQNTIGFTSDSTRLCRNELTIILQPCTIRHKFRLCTEFTRARHVRAPTMRLRRNELTIILQPCATRHKFWLYTGFTRPFWPVRCRPEEGAGRLPKRTAVAGRLVQDVPYGIAARR